MSNDRATLHGWNPDERARQESIGGTHWTRRVVALRSLLPVQHDVLSKDEEFNILRDRIPKQRLDDFRLGVLTQLLND